jgi:hypothetical protein
MVDNWRKSSWSANSGSESCIEVASADAVLIRDTTNRDGLTLSMPATAWKRFVAAIK